ncbi:MAG: hypothetical protein AB1679_06305 [Actinomycetota bacterium]
MASRRSGHSRRSRRQGFALAGLLPATLHLVLTLGYDSSYSHQLYAREAFLYQYRHGVYRYRVVGRELVVAVGRVLDHFGVALHTIATDIGHGRPPADLFTALLVVNGVAFVALAMLLYAVTARAADEWRLSYVIVVVLVALSGYVVTPYDNLGYLLTVGAVVVALSGRPWAPPLCLVLAGVGTATRESFVVAVAAVAAVLVGQHGWRALGRVRDPVWWSAAALAGGWLGTYVTLRLVVATDPELDTSLSESVLNEMNWEMSSVVALVFYGLGACALYLTWPALSETARKHWRPTRLLLWLFSAPYVAACVAEGIWFEAMRLLLPVLLCEHVLRRTVADRPPADLSFGDDRVAVHAKALEPQRDS